MIVYMYSVSSWGIIYTCMDTEQTNSISLDTGFVVLHPLSSSSSSFSLSSEVGVVNATSTL
jgi:hypothetical protein